MGMVRRVVEAAGLRRRRLRGALTSRPRPERLLDAAGSAAGSRELDGERAAVELFHRAHLTVTPGSPGMPTPVYRSVVSESGPPPTEATHP